MNLHPGVYLVEADTALWRVIRQHQGRLLLENCRHPDQPLRELAAGDLRNGRWRSVRPAKT